MKKYAFIPVLLLAFLWIQSCKKDSRADENTEAITHDEVKKLAQADNETDKLFDIVDVYGLENGVASKTPGLPSCVTRTVVHNGNTVTVTFEFDPAGCTLPNGNTYAGTLILTRTLNPAAQSMTGSLVFDNFYVNDIQIDGSSAFERLLSNANGNPQTTYDFDFTITYSNGDMEVRQGNRVREWIAGYNTPVMADDVFLITGNGHFELRNGDEYNILIVNPLRRELSCPFYVSGTMNIEKNNETYILDYGNGNCDNEATLTLPNGTVQVIQLGN